MPNILIIEDDTAFCKMLQNFLLKKGYDVVISFDARDAKTKLEEKCFDVILTDLRLPNYDGIQMLSDIKEKTRDSHVIIMTGYAEVGTAVRAMKKGAYDYISKPFTPDEIITIVENALESRRRTSSDIPKMHGAKAKNAMSVKGVTGTSEASEKLKEYVRLVAPTDMSVLITGESGTGKEVTARAIHDHSARKDFNFIAVDCGAIPKEIATSEFFGHIKGSFTGAIEDKIGQFEAANKGTLFLDEIGNLSYENQIQLLRALEERKIKRVGSTREIEVDVRIISATNENLMKAVEKGTFREDLYHRLNEFFIEIPSLSERNEDIILFADYFLNKSNEALNKDVLGFSSEVMYVFQKYNWPGNLRELKNVIKRAVLLTSGDYVVLTSLPKIIMENHEKDRIPEGFSKEAYEKKQIIKALKQANFNKSKAARLLQVTRKTLYNKINHYNLDA